MPAIPIENLDDARLAIYRNVKATNQTRDLGQFVLEGEKLFLRLRESRFPMASALVTVSARTRIEPHMPAGTPLYVVPDPLISDLVGYNFHLGVLSCGLRIEWPSLEILVERNDATMTLVVCPHLDNPENLGALLRIGEAFGVAAVLHGSKAPDALSRRVLRVSMGASLRIPTYQPPDLLATLHHLRDAHGFTLAAAVSQHHGATPLDTFRRDARVCLLVGNESHGLEPDWATLCDERVTIPMRAGADSLNVAVAAGILLYHLSRP